MENLEQLRKKLHESVDSKINALIKPKFEVGKVYYDTNNKQCMICYNEDKNKRYGFGTSGDWRNVFYNWDTILWQPCPQELWQQALEKEAVRLYSKANKVICLSNGNPTDITKGSILCYSDKVFYKGAMVMKNGIWATKIEQKSLGDIVDEYYKTNDGFGKFVIEHKSELIEILTNLPD